MGTLWAAPHVLENPLKKLTGHRSYCIEYSEQQPYIKPRLYGVNKPGLDFSLLRSRAPAAGFY